jgi:hypoxanthine phosphoribosyltransferase
MQQDLSKTKCWVLIQDVNVDMVDEVVDDGTTEMYAKTDLNVWKATGTKVQQHICSTSAFTKHVGEVEIHSIRIMCQVSTSVYNGSWEDRF